nr:hypothetical protein Iba_chr02aCG1800 [Ipomoea batatas]
MQKYVPEAKEEEKHLIVEIRSLIIAKTYK